MPPAIDSRGHHLPSQGQGSPRRGPAERIVVVNDAAGSGALPDGLFDGFRAMTLDEAVAAWPGRTPADALVAVWGGDGTARTVAQLILGTDAVLLPCPGGTHNHFAKAAGLLTLDDVRAAIERGHDDLVDVGLAGGQLFLNTCALGWYVDLVERRQRLQQRMPRRLAKALSVAAQASRIRRVHLDLDGRPFRVWMVWLGNGSFSLAPMRLAERDDLADGVIDVRLLGVGGRVPKLRAAVALLAHRAQASPLIDRFLVPACTLRFHRRAAHASGGAGTVLAALDGELVRLPNPVEVRCATTALRIRRAPLSPGDS